MPVCGFSLDLPFFLLSLTMSPTCIPLDNARTIFLLNGSANVCEQLEIVPRPGKRGVIGVLLGDSLPHARQSQDPARGADLTTDQWLQCCLWKNWRFSRTGDLGTGLVSGRFSVELGQSPPTSLIMHVSRLGAVAASRDGKPCEPGGPGSTRSPPYSAQMLK